MNTCTRLGKIYLQSGDAVAAEEEFSRALQMNKSNEEAKSLLQSLSQSKKIKNAS